MIPGEVIPLAGEIVLNEDRKSTTLEPFEPASHASKEKADALSMWLVIIFGLIVALMMRYYFMPTLEKTEEALWLLPVLLIFTLKPLHKAISHTLNMLLPGFVVLYTSVRPSLAAGRRPYGAIATCVWIFAVAGLSLLSAARDIGDLVRALLQ